jgi:hypothetical protein
MSLLHRRNVIVRTWRCANGRLQIEGYEDCFDSSLRKFLDNFVFLLWHPGAIPVFRQRVHVGLLAGNPFTRVWVAMNVNDSHGLPQESVL